MKILLYRAQRSMGDDVACIPCVVQLRKLYPQAHISWSGHREVGMLALVDELVSFGIVKINKDGVFEKESVDWLKQFDLIISWFHLMNSPALRQELGPGKLVCITNNVHADVYMPTQYLQSLCNGLKIAPGIVDYGFPVLPTERKGTVLLLPRGNNPYKQWMFSHWAKLAVALPEAPLLVIDGDSWMISADILKKRKCEVLPRTSLPDLVKRFGTLKSFVGLDTGLSHLAGAVGLPGVFMMFDAWNGWKIPSPVKCMSNRATVEEVLAALV